MCLVCCIPDMPPWWKKLTQAPAMIDCMEATHPVSTWVYSWPFKAAPCYGKKFLRDTTGLGCDEMPWNMLTTCAVMSYRHGCIDLYPNPPVGSEIWAPRNPLKRYQIWSWNLTAKTEGLDMYFRRDSPSPRPQLPEVDLDSYIFFWRVRLMQRPASPLDPFRRVPDQPYHA